MNRRGYTLLELLVSLGVGGIVLGLVGMIALRHQRFHRDIVTVVERSDDLTEVVAMLPISLRAIAPGEGDIASGGARDTALQFRATIASAVVCDSAAANVLLAPADAWPRLTSVLGRPEAGDTAWFLDASGPAESWTARAIAATLDSSAVCRIGLGAPFGASPRVSIGLRLAAPPPPGAAVVRVTRPWRYSIYHASDGGWYLGAKEWNPAAVRFNTIQPVAGPLLGASAGGLRFRYLDSAGAPLPAIPPDPTRIAAIEVSVRVDSVVPGAYAHAASLRGGATAVIALRNRVR